MRASPKPPALDCKVGTWIVAIEMPQPSGAIRLVQWNELDSDGKPRFDPWTVAHRLLPGENICQSSICLDEGPQPRFQRPLRMRDNWQYLQALTAYIAALFALWADP